MDLEQGVNVLGVQEGVLGPREFVELEDRALYCGYKCLTEDLTNPDYDEDRRIA